MRCGFEVGEEFLVAGDPDTLVPFLVCRGELLRGDESIGLGYLVDYTAKLVVGSKRDLSVWITHVLDKGGNFLLDGKGVHVESLSRSLGIKEGKDLSGVALVLPLRLHLLTILQ